MNKLNMISLLRRAAALSLATVIVGGAAVTVMPQTGDISVTVNAAATVTGIKLDKTSMSLGKGESYTLKATISPSNAGNKTVSWSTTNKKVVTVSGGKIKAVGTGTATVTAKTSNGKTAKCTVTVKNTPNKVSISKTTLSLGVGETYTLSASVPNGSAAAVRTFRTSNSSIIKMTKTNWTGSFKAVKPGTAWVTVKLYNGKEASCKITVKKAPSSVKISKGLLNLKLGQTYTLSSTVPNGTAASKRTYRTSNSSIVKMTKTDWTGSFKAVKAGTAYVTVRTYNGKESSCKVVVTDIPVTKLTLDKNNITLHEGQTAALKAVISPYNALNKTVTWSTSDARVASVSGGKITAKSAGTAKITAKSNNGKTAVCTVVVQKVTGFVKLTDKMQTKYDEKDTSGNTSVSYSNLKAGSSPGVLFELPENVDVGEVISIKYMKDTNTVQMMYSSMPKKDKSIYMTSFELDFNKTPQFKTNFGWIFAQEGQKEGTIVMTSSAINAKTFTKNSTVKFSRYETEGLSNDAAKWKEAPQRASDQLVKAMNAFDKLLYSKYGMHMKDIGFDSYS